MKNKNMPIPEQVKLNVIQYLEKHDLGTLVAVSRASEYAVDDYLYHVVAKTGYGYSVWTSWNETTHCLNHGHYGLTLSQVVEVHYKFYRTLSNEHVLAPVVRKNLLEIFSAEFVEELISMEDEITGNTFLEDVAGHFFENVLQDHSEEELDLNFSEFSSVIVRKCVEKELAARLGI